MTGAKPWQIAAIVIGLLGGVALITLNALSGEKPSLTQELFLVDVETGQIFRSVEDTTLIPATHPATGRSTLYPVAKVDGTWVISSRYIEDIRRTQKDITTFDPSTGKITTPSPDVADLPSK